MHIRRGQSSNKLLASAKIRARIGIGIDIDIGVRADAHAASCQLSQCKPGTRENSRLLRVTNVA